ncbi:hypothetical protein Vafri_8519 [Volvox africanus]|nr:hypothetical protein Vafri_8519 [Volvox africanus]
MARPQKALVVDDLAVNRLILGTILQKLGFEVLEAENGLQCIDVYNQERTHLVCVFLDLQMPVADGWAATKGIRELESQTPNLCQLPVPVVVCTASCLDDLVDNGQTVAQRAVSLGANGAVRKPFTVCAVQRILDEYAPQWRSAISQDVLVAPAPAFPNRLSPLSAAFGLPASAATPISLSSGLSCQDPKVHAFWASGQCQSSPPLLHHHPLFSSVPCMTAVAAAAAATPFETAASDMLNNASAACSHSTLSRAWCRRGSCDVGTFRRGGTREQEPSGASGMVTHMPPPPAPAPQRLTQRPLSCDIGLLTAAMAAAAVQPLSSGPPAPVASTSWSLQPSSSSAPSSPNPWAVPPASSAVTMVAMLPHPVAVAAAAQ